MSEKYLVVIPAPDIDRAAEFYSRLWGAEGERVSPRRHHFFYGDSIWACVDPSEEELEFSPNLDYAYFSVNDLDATYQRAKTAGCRWLEDAIRQRPWRERSFYARDPFGNPICFVEDDHGVAHASVHNSQPCVATGPTGLDKLRDRRDRSTPEELEERLLRTSPASYYSKGGTLFLTSQRLMFGCLTFYHAEGDWAIYSWHLCRITEIGGGGPRRFPFSLIGRERWYIQDDERTYDLSTPRKHTQGWLDALAHCTGLTVKNPNAS